MAACSRFRHAVFCAAALGVLIAAPAFADSTPTGCSPDVMAAQQAEAQSRIAESKMVDDEIFTMDDSVLALTCFNKSAAVTAQQSGDIFSGDFRADLAGVVDDALVGMFSNYKDRTAGSNTGAVSYGPEQQRVDQSADAMDFRCDQIGRLWDSVNNEGVKTDQPFKTRDERLSGVPLEGESATKQAAMQSPANVAITENAVEKNQALEDARAQNPVPTAPAPGETLCDQLKKGGMPATTACNNP